MSGSASGAQTLQDFLISINYQINQANQQKTDRALKNSTYLAVETGKAFVKLAEDIWTASHRMAEAFDDLYFASQRTGATIESLKALGYAARQMGSSAQGMSGAIEAIGKLIATNPAGESFLRSLGVQTRDANGRLLETGKIVESLGSALRKMPLPQANVVGNMFGIDYRTLLAMRQGLGQYSEEYRNLQRAIHLDSEQAGRDANRVATESRALGAAFDVVGDKVKAQFSRNMADAIHQFRVFFVAHFDDISRAIVWADEKFHAFVEAIEQLASRGVDAIRQVQRWFNGLDEQTKAVIITFGEMVIAWRLLNTAFATSPLGRVLLLGTAILALLDDFNAWKEGGKHLIPWENWTTEIDKVRGLFDAFATDIGAIKNAIMDLVSALTGLGGQGDGSFSKAFRQLSLDAIEGFGRTLHNLMGDMAHLIELMAKLASGDLTGAMAVMKDWKSTFKSPSERAEEEARAQGYSPEGLQDQAGRRARAEGGDWWYRLFNAPAPGESATARFYNRVRRMAGGTVKEDAPTPTPGRLGPLMDLVGHTEGTGSNYNDTYGHGKFTGGEVDLTGMTLDQIDDLQTRMLRAGGQSPVGRFQFNQETLRDMRGAMGLKGNELFDPEMQRSLFAKRIQRQGGPTPNNLRAIWPSLPGGSQDTHRATDYDVQDALDRIGRDTPNTSSVVPDGIKQRLFDDFDNYLRKKQEGQAPGATPLVSPDAGNKQSFWNQDIDIHINGANEPTRIAAEIERQQNRASRDLIRNSRSALV